MAIPEWYPKRRYADRLLRIKGNTADDPDYQTLGIGPDTILIPVTGAAAGSYEVEIVPELDPDAPTPAIVMAAGVGGDDAATAAAVAAAVNLAIADTTDALRNYLYRARSAGANVYLDVRPLQNPPQGSRFTVGTAAPGGTFDPLPADELWPVTAVTSNQRDYNTTQPGTDHVAIAFVPVDGAGEPLADDLGMTFTVQTLRYVERIQRTDPDNALPRTPGITSSLETPLFPVRGEYRVPFFGGRFGIRLSSIVNPPTGFSALELYYREVED